MTTDADLITAPARQQAVEGPSTGLHVQTLTTTRQRPTAPILARSWPVVVRRLLVFGLLITDADLVGPAGRWHHGRVVVMGNRRAHQRPAAERKAA